MSRLAEADLFLHTSESEETKQLKAEEAAEAARKRLVHLWLLLGGLTGPGGIGAPLLVPFEGWDASGKGGAIRRFAERLDPRHVRVDHPAASAPLTEARALGTERAVLPVPG